MQKDQNATTPWHTIENQIKGVWMMGKQIEDLRCLLAEEWKVRLARPETPKVYTVDRPAADAVYFGA